MKAKIKLKKHYDYVIVGTGPSGLAAAYGLLKNDSGVRILMIEAGYVRKIDKCFMEEKMKRFIDNPDIAEEEPRLWRGCEFAHKCGVCKTIAGFGGCLSPNVSAKLCFPPSGKRLPKILGEERVLALAAEAWEFYSKFAEIDEPYPVCATGNPDKDRIVSIVKESGYQLFEHPARAVGEIEMNRFLSNLRGFIETKVDVITGCEPDLLNDLEWKKNRVKIGKDKVSYGKIVLATGRFGFRSIRAFLESIDMVDEPENMGFGPRILLPNKYLWPIGKHYPDFKVKYEDELFKYETFCFNGSNNGGRLKYMNYNGFVNVDGLLAVDFEGDKFRDMSYGNFAILVEAKSAKVHYNGGYPKGCTSLDKFPALQMAEFSKGMQEIVAKVNNVSLEEIGRDAIFTPPAYENVWGRMKTNNGFWVKPNVAVIGDASGIAMGIISSMIMGLAVAKQSLR